MAPPKQHLVWLDTVKGAGISMVVLGHINNLSFVHDFVYCFHMPLFFVVSGFLHRVDHNPKAYARKKAITLLLPYVTFLATVTLLKLPHFVELGLTTERVTHALFLLLWGGKRLRGEYGVLWFLTCLYLTQQGMNYLLRRFSQPIVSTIVGVGLLLSYVNYKIFPNFTLPLDANVVLAAAPFFLAGYLLRGQNTMARSYALFAIISVAVVTWFTVHKFVIYLDIKDNTYGYLFLSHLLALGCAIAVFQLAQSIPTRWRWPAVLIKLGTLSLPIMFLHTIILSGPTAHAVRQYGMLVAFLVTLGVSWILASLLTRFTLTRALFLGSLPDFEKLTARNQTLTSR